MNKIVHTLFYVVLLSQAVGAQFYERGLPFITNYLPTQTGGSEQNWAIVQDKRGVMYFGNNDKGVLEYDGVAWRSIPISNNSIVRSLAIDTLGIIYAGGVGEFGHLVPNSKGKLEYVSLSERLDSAAGDFTDVWKTHAEKDIIYFCTGNYTYVYYSRPDSIQVLANEPGVFMSHMVDGELYHSNLLKGLMVQRDGVQEMMPEGDFFIQKYITCILPMPGDQLFIGTAGTGSFI